MPWPALHKLEALYRASHAEANLKEDILRTSLGISQTDPAFGQLMGMTVEELLNFSESARSNIKGGADGTLFPTFNRYSATSSGTDFGLAPPLSDTFFLMTTAMNYIEHKRSPRKMTTHWPVIRENIKQCVARYRPALRVRIVHFVVTGDKAHIDKEWQTYLDGQGEEYEVVDTGFPKTWDNMKALDIHLSPQNHILVDMANLIRYAQSDFLGIESYAGYDRDFVSSINHIYLQYSNFVKGIKANTGPLIRFEKERIVKACFEPDTLSVDRDTLGATTTFGNCKGRCGFHTQKDYCSVCARLQSEGKDPQRCKLCPNLRSVGSERCQECIDSDSHAPPVITKYVPATEICPDNQPPVDGS